MTEPPIAMLQSALRDLMILGEIVQAIAEANKGDLHDAVPSTWVELFGREVARLVDKANTACDRIARQ